MTRCSLNAFERFAAAIDKSPISLDDGALGTYIRFVFGPDAPPELANLFQPRFVTDIHARYAAEGVRFLTTNTWAANTPTLRSFCPDQGDPTDLAYRVSRAGAQLARRAARRHPGVLVAGCIGPVRDQVRPTDAMIHEPMTASSLRDAFRPQIRGLRDGGADLIKFETVHRLDEVDAALSVIAEECPELPVVVQFAVHRGVCEIAIRDGTLLEDCLAHVLARREIVGVGTNCVHGPDGVGSVALAILRCLDQPISRRSRVAVFLKPNVGSLTFTEGVRDDRVVRAYEHIWDDVLRALSTYGDRRLVIGGCCGTRESHIKILRGCIDRAERKQPETGERLRFRRGEGCRTAETPRILCAVSPAAAPDTAFEHAMRDLVAEVGEARRDGIDARLLATGGWPARDGGTSDPTLLLYDLARWRLAEAVPIVVQLSTRRLTIEDLRVRALSLSARRCSSLLVTSGPLDASQVAAEADTEVCRLLGWEGILALRNGSVAGLQLGGVVDAPAVGRGHRIELLDAAGADHVVVRDVVGPDQVAEAVEAALLVSRKVPLLFSPDAARLTGEPDMDAGFFQSLLEAAKAHPKGIVLRPPCATIAGEQGGNHSYLTSVLRCLRRSKTRSLPSLAVPCGNGRTR